MRPAATGPRTRVRRTLLPLLGVLALVAGCTVGPSSRPPLATLGPAAPPAGTPVSSAAASRAPATGPGGDGQQQPPATWTGCPFDAIAPAGRSFTIDCTEITVPRIYGTTGDPAEIGSFRIRIARARQPGLATGAPDLVVLDGLPAEHGSEQIATLAGALPAAVTARYAVVVVDLRGTGGSSPLRCLRSSVAQDLIDLPNPRTATDEIDAFAKSVTLACSDEADTSLTRYNLPAAADDLDSVRAALGSATLSVLGTGFGATLGAVYADRYPGRVGRMVLDGPSDPLLSATALATGSAVAAEAALKTFEAACPSFSGGCPLGADPGAAINNLVAAAYRSSTETDDGQPIGGSTVLLLLQLALGAQKSWPQLASALAALAGGDPNPAGTLLATQLTDDPTGLLTAGLLYACNDYGDRLSGSALSQAATAAAAKAPVFGAFEIGQLGLCGSWPTPQSALGKVQAIGAPPIVVVGSVNDPISGYPAVQSLTGELTSAVLISWQSSDHDAYPASACVAAAVNAYLVSGTVPTPGTLCPP